MMQGITMIKAGTYRRILFIAGALIIIIFLLNWFNNFSGAQLSLHQIYLPEDSFISPYNAVNDSTPNASLYKTFKGSMPSGTAELSELNAEVLQEVTLPVWNNTNETVAIIVPYRDRTKHLFQFLSYMLPFLSKQRKRYVIVVTEQDGDEAFNRAKLFNVAVREIRKSAPGDRLYGIECFIFHDVDKVPASTSAIYECGQNVRQLVTAFKSQWRITRLYKSFLGGVTAFSWAHVRTINGASNLFTGWGGEDDELLVRLKLNKISVDRVSGRDGVFDEYDANHKREKNADRYKLITRKNVTARWKTDGINQTRYELLARINYDAFVWLLVSI